MNATRCEDRGYLPIWKGAMDAAAWPARRRELKALLERHCYGVMPAFRGKAEATLLGAEDEAFAGKAVWQRHELSIETPRGFYRLPVDLVIPKAVAHPPVVLHLAFRRALPDKYAPVEEIIDKGFALVSVCYEDISPDSHDGNFSTGLCGHLVNMGPDGVRKATEPGRIGVWAWCASRILDWLSSVGEVDAAHTAVAGHSRLGKTALWAAACDGRFWGAVSNCSGFGGAACARHGHGERVADFIRAGSWDWFCENFKLDLGKEDDRAYDQHFLLALVAPRLLSVGSAERDAGADPAAEFLGSRAASSAWEMLGCRGLVCPDRMPVPGDSFGEGNVHYHLRPGTHFFSRTDWNLHLDFLASKL